MNLKKFFHENYFLSNIYLNFHKVDENLYRSAQPTPKQLEKIIKKYNIKTIINLRGNEHSKDLIEEEKVAKKYGVKLITLNLKSRGIPTKEQFFQILNTLKNIEYPALIHCKSGSDRTGLVATLYLHLIKNVPLKQALSQLKFFPYGHIKYSQAGKIDFFFEAFLKSNYNSLTEWVKKEFDREKLNQEFKNKSQFLSFLNDKILKRE